MGGWACMKTSYDLYDITIQMLCAVGLLLSGLGILGNCGFIVAFGLTMFSIAFSAFFIKYIYDMRQDKNV